MKISETSRQITVMLCALETDVLPELKSTSALTSAGLIKSNLEELLKRETTTPSILSGANREGAAIVEAMRALLAGETGMASLETPTPGAGFSFHQVRNEYEALLNEITQLAQKLSAARTPASDKAISALLHRAAEWECGVHARLREPVTSAPINAGINHDPLPGAALESFIQSVHPDGKAATITAFERIHGGFAKQTFKFTLRDASGNDSELIARKMDRIPVFSLKAFLIEREFHLLQALHAAGFPVAKPLWVTASPPPGVDANFCIMEKLSGSPPGSFLGGASQLPEPLLLDLAALLARLHSIGLDQFSDYIEKFEAPQLHTDTVESCYRRTVADWKRYTKEVDHLPSPVVAYLFDWLERNTPHDTRPPVLIHSDYGIHNVLARDGRVTAVLDWEAAMFGAPEQDLAWIKPHIARHIDWDRFLAHYVASGGREPDTKSFDYYAAFSAMFSLAGVTRSVCNYQSGAVPDIRITMIEHGFASHLMQYAMTSIGNKP